MQKLVSIIILNYNKYQDTIACLNSLIPQSYKNFEIFIVDNGSKYALYEQLKKELQKFKDKLKIQLIRSKVNLYFGAGNNKAIKSANGEFICLLNADTEVMPNFIETMVDFLEQNPLAGMITPKIKLFSYKDYIWTVGGEVNFKSTILIFNRGYLDFDPDNSKYNKVELVDYAPGTALFVKKKYLETIGLMDEIYFMYLEDPDWNFRAREKGFLSYYVPSSIVYHKIRIRKYIDSKRATFNDFFFKRNKQILIWRHASIKQLIFLLSSLYLYLFVDTIKNLNDKKKTLINFMAFWLGLRSGIRRRFKLSCRKYILKDFYYIKTLQKG